MSYCQRLDCWGLSLALSWMLLEPSEEYALLLPDLLPLLSKYYVLLNSDLKGFGKAKYFFAIVDSYFWQQGQLLVC